MHLIKHNGKGRSIKKINWVGENGKGTRAGSDRVEKIKKNRGKKMKKWEKDFPYGCVS